MITIMLVDDEVLAMEYLKNMMDWEAHGCRIIGCVSNGKRAVELYEKEWPDIVISDIRMPGMDGIELTRKLKERNPDAIVVLLSAYKDFEYAQQAIQYGASNYLIKHELCEEKIVRELKRVQEQLQSKNKKDKIYQTYFMNQLIHNQIGEMEEEKLGKRLFLLLVHKRNYFHQGSLVEEEWSAEEQEVLRSVIEKSMEDTIMYVADVPLTANNLLVLYRIENTTSQYTVNQLIERKTAQIGNALKGLPECYFNILFSCEIMQKEISMIFQRMSRQIRSSFFWKANKALYLSDISEKEEKVIWGNQISNLKNALYEEGTDMKETIRQIFREVQSCQMESCKSLVHLFDGMERKVREEEGFQKKDNMEKLFTIEEVEEYYITCFEELYQKIHQEEYSKQVENMIRYIRQNYDQELSLEMLGEKFQMNGVYLGQIFKREVGITFLKYLTNVRIEEAKRLLQKENCTIAETASLVGYRTSQYFSHIFTRTVGMKPQEYKRWKEKDLRKDN